MIMMSVISSGDYNYNDDDKLMIIIIMMPADIYFNVDKLRVWNLVEVFPYSLNAYFQTL